MTAPMTTDVTRRGRFLASRVAYETMSVPVRRAFERQFLVHRADLTIDSDEYVIQATSPLFAAIGPGEAAPFYALTINMTNGEATIDVRRDAALDAAMAAAPPQLAESFTAPATIPIAEKRKVIERELGFRRRVYPKSVADGRMKQAEADHQIAVMEAILKDYAA